MKTKNKKSMKTMYKYLFLLAGLIFSINIQSQNGVSAQQSSAGTAPDSTTQATEKPIFTRHELSLWGSGGYSTLFYKPTIGARDPFNFGGTIGVGYTIFFNKNFGLLLGGELAFYKASYKLNHLMNDGQRVLIDIYDIGDNRTTEHEFYYRSEFTNYAERQTLLNMNIPIMLQFQTSMGESHKFFAGLGFKFGIPLTGFYAAAPDSKLKASGYSETLNQNFFDQRDMGFGEFRSNDNEQKLSFDKSYTGFAELGIRWKLASRLYMYTGIYFDYTFNDILRDKHGKEFLEYGQTIPINDDRITTNSILTSSYTQNGVRNQIINKVSPLSFGLKLRFGIDASKQVEKKGEKQAEKSELEKAQSKANVPCNCYDIESLRQLFDLYDRKCGNDNHKNEDAGKDNNPNNNSGNNQGNNPNNNQGNINGDSYKDSYKNPYKDSNKDAYKEPYREPYKDSYVDKERERARYNNEYNNKEHEYVERERTAQEYGKVKDMMIIYTDGYEINQTELSPIMKIIIDDKLPLLQQYNSDRYTIVCEGHTCNLGTPMYNWNLGQMRAEVVRNYLIMKGFKAENLVAISKGSTMPITANTSESSRKPNRRVVFIVLEKNNNVKK